MSIRTSILDGVKTIRNYFASQLTFPNGQTMKQDANGNITLTTILGKSFKIINSALQVLFQIDQNTGIVTINNTVGSYKGITTAGLGLSAIYASYSQTAKVAAVTNALNYTPPALVGTYRLSWAVDVNASVTHSFTVVASWKDASGNAMSQVLGGSDDNGSALVAGAITNVLGTGNYYGSALIQIDNSATPITLSTVGTFTSVTYNLTATLEQLT